MDSRDELPRSMHRLLRADRKQPAPRFGLTGTGAGGDATAQQAGADLWSDFREGEAKISNLFAQFSNGPGGSG